MPLLDFALEREDLQHRARAGVGRTEQDQPVVAVGGDRTHVLPVDERQQIDVRSRMGRTTTARRDPLDGTTTTVPPGIAATWPVTSPARGTGTGSPIGRPQQSRRTSVRQPDRRVASTQMPPDPSGHRAIGRRSPSAAPPALTPSRWRSCASWRSIPVGVASQS